MIIDAEDAILGRLASKISKDLLKGEQVIVINAEKTVISGNPKAVLERFKEKTKRGDPHKGPFYPKYPDKVFRRVVRGMLPFKRQRGRKAYRRLKVYTGNPEKLRGERVAKSAEALRSKYLTLKDVCKKLGAKLG